MYVTVYTNFTVNGFGDTIVGDQITAESIDAVGRIAKDFRRMFITLFPNANVDYTISYSFEEKYEATINFLVKPPARPHIQLADEKRENPENDAPSLDGKE